MGSQLLWRINGNFQYSAFLQRMVSSHHSAVTEDSLLDVSKRHASSFEAHVYWSYALTPCAVFRTVLLLTDSSFPACMTYLPRILLEAKPSCIWVFHLFPWHAFPKFLMIFVGPTLITLICSFLPYFPYF